MAGRGTDIKISPILENNGGLHVILTFMPANLRIEEQAFGRAARKGEKGSGQIIMLSNESYENNLKLQKIEEEDNFNYLMYYYKEKNILFHQYFKDFCYYLKILNEKSEDKNLFSDMREQWSFFIYNNTKETIEKSGKKEYFVKMFQLEKLILEKNFKCFKESLSLNNINNYRIKNPFLVIKSFSTLGELDRAIDIAKNMALGAYYIKAIALIKNKVLNYQNISYSCLDKLKDIILHLINQLNNYINIIKDIQKYNNNHKLNENNFLLNILKILISLQIRFQI